MKLFEPPVLIIVLAIVLIIFGPNQLPGLGKSIGKTIRSIREGLEGTEPEAELPARPAQARGDDSRERASDDAATGEAARPL